jgi:hypothetical protein
MKPIMHEKPMAEMSQLQRQLLGQDHVKFYTQQEFDQSLAIAQAEIMTVAIETTKRAIMIEREECAKLADECVDIEKLGETIRNRIPSQRQ